ncbi:MAG: SAM-dependent methyltransferase [Cyanobacteriota bacterium]|nr:SAM-dependent methyltransferase [Cyanobacteriota bacterium]
MTAPSPQAPPWLRERLEAAGGSVPFGRFMAWALHDPHHGYYGAGRARIGPGGDFATSPSLGEEFAALLLPQLIEWFDQLPEEPPGPGERLSLLETGPGEGQLAGQLARGLARARPDLATRLEVVLLDPNPGMVARQRRSLADSPLPLRWATWEELGRAPLRGVAIAHEVLDALPVERVLWDGTGWRWQQVACPRGTLALVPGPPLPAETLEELEALGVITRDAAGGRPPGWCTELHPGLGPWFQACGQAMAEGVLLVVDYALEARRYYAPSRANGTLMAYRGQTASADPLAAPGDWDLTAHLCLETTRRAAAAAGWRRLGERRQGEALLALGLAERLASLGHAPSADLAACLARREQLLRLVDPMALGEFRWLLWHRDRPDGGRGEPRSRCLEDPRPDPQA